jgi:hypothetical protein
MSFPIQQEHSWVFLRFSYSTTWSFPEVFLFNNTKFSCNAMEIELREVYKCIKTFHFSLSTDDRFKVHLPWRNPTKKLHCVWHSDEQNVVERESSILFVITFRECRSNREDLRLFCEYQLESRGFETSGSTSSNPLTSLLRCGASYSVTTTTKDLEIRSEQLEFFKIAPSKHPCSRFCEAQNRSSILVTVPLKAWAAAPSLFTLGSRWFEVVSLWMVVAGFRPWGTLSGIQWNRSIYYLIRSTV